MFFESGKIVSNPERPLARKAEVVNFGRIVFLTAVRALQMGHKIHIYSSTHPLIHSSIDPFRRGRGGKLDSEKRCFDSPSRQAKFTLVASVVNRPQIFQSDLARHTGRSGLACRELSIPRTDPFAGRTDRFATRPPSRESTPALRIRIENHGSLALVEAHAEMLKHVQPSE